MSHISVVIPVYKAPEILGELHKRLVKTLSQITEDYEIILVNDDSPLGDWEVIQRIALIDHKVKGINLSRNFGQHYAITAGLDNCNGDWVIVMDCDLQDQPEEILKLYNKAQEGYDVVWGRRYERKDNFLKKITSKLFMKIFDFLSGYKSDHTTANYSIVSSKVIENFRKMKELNRSYPSFIRWIGFKTGYIDIEHAPRLIGKSSYTYRKLFSFALDTIVAHTNRPLRLSIGFGFTLAFFAFLYALFLTSRFFIFDVPVEGWTSTMVSIWFIGGLMFVNLGIVGLYIGKIFDETKKRPLYVIDKRINFN
jgi:polyisoprenyl-phosphate glycosyltransferase